MPGQSGGKGKEREHDDGAQAAPADAQGLDQDVDPDVDGEDEEIEYSDDEVRRLGSARAWRGADSSNAARTVWHEPEGERAAEARPPRPHGAL